ncbi:poly [ADP-ribose] polymerase 9 [Xenopus tropicalis]|uniref:LOC100145202 protein n=1 Tax=Xenopus tropicalis TaxID=8364 RepID=B0JZG2_XENTR|nr:poly [ADP-ribose] polymerase 9 [Xenopus tropicalis]AAI59166.1 LOC100145202 protein [Xenopus tropicalis]|eukprot:NP_001120163.1 poly [ADP-ribose] polymerase 9 [Xenopus tropicalis]
MTTRAQAKIATEEKLNSMESRTMVLREDTYSCLYHIQSDLNNVLIRKYNCEMELKGPRLAAPPSGPEELVYEKKLPGGLRLSVWKGDLTGQVVDAVVNAANEDLMHIGGLALALAKAGGAVIQDESRNHIAKHGKVKAGSIAVTSAGNLPCKVLIHAVGPEWTQGRSAQCELKLERVIRSILGYVRGESSIRTVAIPAISSGIFGFPLHRCAEIIAGTTKKFCDTESYHKMAEIRFVNIDTPTVTAMKAACEGAFGMSDQIDKLQGSAPDSSQRLSANQSPSYSHNATGSGLSYAAVTAHSSPSYPGAASYSGSSGSANPRAHSSGSQPAFTIYGLNLYLMKGCIEDQKTCVIVNSLGANRNPSEGNISSAILSRAGGSLRHELLNRGQYLPARDIMIPTRGYNLPCNFVYHVILEQRSDPKKQILMEAMNACLYTAHKYNAPSISFPALGTGVLRFPKSMVAEVMTEMVLTFAAQKPCIMDVFFVIHPSDWETYSEFQKAFQAQQRLRTPAPQEERKGPQGMAAAAEEMSLTLSGPRHEDTDDAMLWLQNITKAPGSVLIQNKHILLFGKKEHRALGSPQFSRVEISEVLGDGKASLEIKGSQKDVVRAAVQVELMLLDAQEEHTENLQEELFESAVQWMYDVYKYPARENRRIEAAYVSGKNHTLDVGTVSHSIDFKAFKVKAPKQEFKLHREWLLPQKLDYSQSNSKFHWSGERLVELKLVEKKWDKFSHYEKEFKKAKLEIVKVEQIFNHVLFAVFNSKKDSIGDKVTELYQRVPGQFRNLICSVGFHRLYTGAKDPKQGPGLGFNKQLDRALQAGQESPEGLVYVFLADVVVGKTKEAKNLPFIPLNGGNIFSAFNSLVDSNLIPQSYVIFDPYQAYPRYLFTCKRNGSSV